MPTLTVAQEIKAVGPWLSTFPKHGITTGGTYDPVGDPRVTRFFEVFPNVQRILELGSFEGGHTLALAEHPGVSRVVGLESRDANLKKSALLRRLVPMPNAAFSQCNLETVSLQSYGQFDAIFCCGLLYHLPDPIKLLKQFAGAAPNIYIGTHYAIEVDIEVNGVRGSVYKEHGLKDTLSGMSMTSLWLTLDCLLSTLTECGYEILSSDPVPHGHGPFVNIFAKLK